MNKRILLIAAGFVLAASAVIYGALTATAESDVIAVRVMPNPGHYDIARWYENQGFSGAPQELIIDGYEAIRDGRTVYVSAANVDLGNWRQSASISETIPGRACAVKIGINQASGLPDCSLEPYGKNIPTQMYEGAIAYNAYNNTPFCSTSQCPDMVNANKCRWVTGPNPGWSYQCYVRDEGTKTIHTNVYLISYNQDVSDKTSDILGQLIKNWSFNTNLGAANNGLATVASCSISNIPCSSDSDCSSGQSCAKTGEQAGYCQLNEAPKCLVDGDCSEGFFCSSLKAKIIRDLKRIATLRSIEEALAGYKEEHGLYPTLSGGTYLSGNSLSSWPSWQEVFLPAIGLSKASDPINRLGACPGYDPRTCWSASSSRFVFEQEGSYMQLPAGSRNFAYKSLAGGSSYNICAVLESKADGYQLSNASPNSSNCVVAAGIQSSGNSGNSAPRLTEVFLAGEAGKEFSGYLRAVDPDNNPLSWSFNTSLNNWPEWSSAPIVKSIFGTNNEKRLFATMAGRPGTYNVRVSVSDAYGGTLSTTTILTISNPAPIIEAADGEFSPSVGNNKVRYNFYIEDSNLVLDSNGSYWYKASGPEALSAGAACAVKLGVDGNTGAPVCSIDLTADNNAYAELFDGRIVYSSYNNTPYCSTTECPDMVNANKCRWSMGTNPAWSNQCFINSTASGPYSVSPLSSGLNFSLGTNSFVPVGIGRYQVSYEVPIPTGFDISQDRSYSFQIKAWDIYNASATKNFSLKLKASAPQLSLSCPSSSRQGKYYECYLGPLYQNNQKLSYSVLAPSGLGVYASTTSAYLYGTPSVAGSHTITVTAKNDYGASTKSDFNLKVNTYCGDGVRQIPNDEGRGGPANDGQEECDGLGNVALNPSESSVTKQYGCTVEAGDNTPNPILENGYCAFKPQAEGGGYCGDGLCQAKVMRNGELITMEDSGNCSSDCVASCIPICNASNVCGDDGCGGSCGTCSNGNSCVKNSCCPPTGYIQLSVDDGHKTYFNGNFVSSADSWDSPQKFSVIVNSGTNTIAIDGFDLHGAAKGIAASLAQGSCSETNTSDISNWKCINASTTGVNLSGWTSTTYDDSSWPAAIFNGGIGPRAGNQLPFNQIWATNSTYDYSRVYCRYSFFVEGCYPKCINKTCGSDGCGGSCGTCGNGYQCLLGSCQLVLKSSPDYSCTPNCAGKTCGDDGCGGSCGTCVNDGYQCQQGNCVASGSACIPDCAGKNCGSNGCGGYCGLCPRGYECPQGTCVIPDNSSSICTPDCDGKTCGSDGCGGSCGTCTTAGFTCFDDSNCACSESCSEAICGAAGCGDCGQCSRGYDCYEGSCHEIVYTKLTGEVCIDNSGKIKCYYESKVAQ